MLSCLLAAQAENLNVFDPVSPPGESIRLLWGLVLAITLGILVVVWGILAYCVYHFRAKPAPDGQTPAQTKEPPQVYGSQPIEVAWTAVPALIVFVLLLVVVRTINEVEVDPANPPEGSKPLYITVIGRQWWWEYQYHDRYPGDEDGEPLFITANELHVPASDVATKRPVYLRLQSADVCHSWWVPRLAGKTDLIPGKTNWMWFQTDRPGLYLGQCAEYCGTQHAHMLLRVVVEPPDDFEKWLANEKKPAVDEDRVRSGRELFLAQSCVNCHTVRGTRARGKFGPDLTHLMSRQKLASGMIDNDRDGLKRWVDDPQKVKPGCLMPRFGLGDREVEQIVDYLMTLK